ncbi:HTTM domain-containing protein [bacterium AH-315-M05]|nr:HTTM domain-containing protein [bacterium AH-315-M05]
MNKKGILLFFLNQIGRMVDWLENRFSRSITHPDTIWLFRRAVYLFLFINTLILLPVADQFWGHNTFLSGVTNSKHKIFEILYLLSNHEITHYYLLFVCGQLFFLLTGLLGIFPRSSSVLVYIFTMNLFNRQPGLSNGGYHVMQIMLFYLIFMNEQRRNNKSMKNTYFSVINNVITNLSFLAARIQLVFVYMTAAAYKLAGDLWLSGEALYYVLGTDEYSHPLATEYILPNDFLIISGNYFALFFQLLFPLLIWFKKTRTIMLWIGVFFHLFIAFVLGLMDFGFAMIACYFVFFEDDKSSQIKEKLVEFLNLIKSR